MRVYLTPIRQRRVLRTRELLGSIARSLRSLGKHLLLDLDDDDTLLPGLSFHVPCELLGTLGFERREIHRLERIARLGGRLGNTAPFGSTCDYDDEDDDDTKPSDHRITRSID